VRTVLAVMLSPGAALTGIPVPSLAEVEAIRAPASENAARWLHLMAATAALIVIVPRLLLALGCGVLEQHRATHLPLAINAPYFARLLRGFRGGPMTVRVVPYSYAVPPDAAAALEGVIRKVFGANASVTVMASVVYGGEDALAVNDSAANVIALFNAAATPEDEAHGRLLDRLRASLGPGGIVVALVDESALRGRWGDEPARLEERRGVWRALCVDHHVTCAFASLDMQERAEAASDLERAVEEAMQ